MTATETPASAIRLVPALAVIVAILLPGCGKGPDSHPAPAPASRPSLKIAFETLLAEAAIPPCPVRLIPFPDHSQFLILGRDGDLWHYDRPLESFPLGTDETTQKVYVFAGNVTKIRIDGSYAYGDMGTIGMALDPAFEKNGFFYVWYADKPDKTVRLDRFRWSGRKEAVEGSRVNVITVSRHKPPGPFHMGGIVQFLPDGTLLICLGDAEVPRLSQDRRDLNGKIIRIKPKPGADGGYDVPADNPHVNDAAWLPEIVAVGVRAPFRGFLRNGKELWFGDVGAIYEEINVFDHAPADFGWGRGKTEDALTDGPFVEKGVTPPVAWWSQKADFAVDDPDYGGETRLSAGIGCVYENVPVDRYEGQLTGKLIFFEIMRGWVRAGPVTPDGRLPTHRHIGHRQFIAEMSVGADGWIYGLTWEGPTTLFRLRQRRELKAAPPVNYTPVQPVVPRTEHPAPESRR